MVTYAMSRGPTPSTGSTPPPVTAQPNRGRVESSRARFAWRRPLSIVNAVWWLNAAIAVVAAGLFFIVADDYPALNSPHLSWWVLAAGFFVAERCVVHLHFRRNAHSFSLGDIPLVFGLIFASAHDLILGGLLGTAATLMLDRRLPPIKLVFNLAQFWLATCLAAIVIQALASPDSIARRRGRRRSSPRRPPLWSP